MEVEIDPSWKEVLQDEFDKKYFEDLAKFVKYEYKYKTVFPPAKFIFNAFNSTPFDKVKVVLLGQDPYHGKDQAMGLSFSVPDNVRIPSSLQNIYKEIKSDIAKDIPASGNLERWAKQGVLLLNATLTVIEGQAGSHQNKGWEEFTDHVIKIVSDKKEHVVFLLWGAYAGWKEKLIDKSKHLVLKAAHPSGLSAHKGFFGSKHFSKTNEYLIKHGIEPIDW